MEFCNLSILRVDSTSITHCVILSNIETDFSISQKSKLILEFLTHICWVITGDSKVNFGQVKTEFD